MPTLKIAGATVYDPLHGIAGQQRDLWIENGRICAPPADPGARPVRTLDARGLVAMPGGVDMHSHIAGSKVNTGRRMRLDEKRSAEPMRRTALARSGTTGSVPSTFATGYLYAGLGYTTAFDAAIAPLDARHAHEEFADTPCVDKGCYLLMGNNHFLMQALGRNEDEKARHYIAWLLKAGGGFAPKLVNPGGVEVWKHRAGGNVHGLDEPVEGFDVTPRHIIAGVAQAAAELRLPHAVHIHANNLGMPGNWATTLATLEALEGRRGHLTHIQFHSYAGGEGDEDTFGSMVEPLAVYVNEHPNITVDVGQVLFGETTSMTGDGPLGYFLSRLYKTPWFSRDTELEAGCGISPIEYKRKSLVHALQWAIGLEWYLLVKDPWQIAMSTDHPNGASFLAYPHVIRLLMDRTYRADVLAGLPPEVRRRSVLADIDRQYTLEEICIITRAAPARMLGLTNKGHLGPGADADITLYLPDANVETMFQLPRYVIKAGKIIVDGGELRATPVGKTLHVAPEHDPAIEPELGAWFDRHSSVRFRNYPVDPSYLGESEIIGGD